MISVALCTYNGERYIEEQLLSILSQSLSVDEIVICDDRSTDGTVEIIKRIQQAYSNVNIQLIINETNKGVTKNFEGALEKCKGDIIFLSDQDDVWEYDKVKKTLEVFNTDQDCLLTFSNANLIDANGKDIGTGLWELSKPILKDEYTIADFLGNRYVTGATVAIRQELLKYTLPIPECWIHDAWLAINACVRGEVKYIDDKLVGYRQHENNVIGAKRRSLVEQIKHTIKNISRSIEFRTTMVDRYTAFLKVNKESFANEEIPIVNNCIQFWTDTEHINNRTRRSGCRIIVKNMCNHNYYVFSNGAKGALVDLFTVFFFRDRL